MIFKTQDPSEVILEITTALKNALERHEHVLWLVSGGSNVSLQVAIMKSLHKDYPELLESLTILPMDERYGPEGHEDSNYQQMLEAGFDAGDAHWYDVLVNDLPLAETVTYYTDLTEEVFAEAQYVIGTFGMGTDGHTAGILPRSPAVVDDTSVVVGYEASDFTRMTLTPQVLVRCNEAYLIAYGTQKSSALEKLAQSDLSLREMPAKLLVDIAEVTVYNDVINREE